MEHTKQKSYLCAIFQDDREVEMIKKIIHSSPFHLDLLTFKDENEAIQSCLENSFIPELFLIQDSESLPQTSLAELNQYEHLKRVPKIIISNHTNMSHIQSIYEFGSNSYLQKPGSYRGLLSILKESIQYWLEKTISPHSHQQSKSILIVEDEENQVFLIQNALEELDFHGSVNFVNDGMEALDFLNKKGQYNNIQRIPNLIFTDLNMPRMSGLEFLREKAMREKIKGIPVITLSISTSEKKINEVYSFGAHVCIPNHSLYSTKKESLLSSRP